MDGKTLFAYALIAALVGSVVWLTMSLIAKRRAYKDRMKGRRKHRQDA